MLFAQCGCWFWKEEGLIKMEGFLFSGMDTFVCMTLHAEEVSLDRKSFLVGGINWEEVIRKAAHGGNNCQYVEGGGEMHGCISNIRYNADGAWHVGAGSERIVCANIKCTHVLRVLLPKSY